jgi:hypothetical protein
LTRNKKLFNLGQVAFIVGGLSTDIGVASPYVELYSPSGGCSHQLASIPIGLWSVSLVQFGKDILACGGLTGPGSGSKNCWRYDLPSDKWISHSTLVTGHHRGTPYLVYNNTIYCVDFNNYGEAFDNATKLWTKNLSSPGNTGEGECSIQYKDSFYILGGKSLNKYVQKYNFTTGQWSFPFTLNSGIYYSSCLLMPNSNGKALILAVDSTYTPTQTATIVDLETNQQTSIATPSYLRAWGNNLVALGTRIFSINGWNWTSNIAVVEEYHPGNNSWSQITAPLIYPRHGGSALKVPASWFNKIPGGCTGVI